jgi:uncharacterized protein
MTGQVQDNPTANRFELDVEGNVAIVEYYRAGRTLTLLHTEVPHALAGRGIGSALARGVLEHARAQGSSVVACCPFMAAFVKSHPEFQDLLAPSPPAG